MNKALFGALIVSTFGLSGLSAMAADLSTEERTELRARADRLSADRVSAPQAGDVKLDRDRGDMKLNPRGDGIKKAKSSKLKKTKSTKRKSNFKESVKKVPGALIR